MAYTSIFTTVHFENWKIKTPCGIVWNAFEKLLGCFLNNKTLLNSLLHFSHDQNV